ncbi:hypothetical protein LAZ67_18001028, partial [Cordylochernes scorpioides]
MSTFLPTKHNLREALLFCFNLKKSATDGHRLLCEAYGKHALSIKSCEYWFRRFKSGDFDTRDKERGGRPIKFEDAELEALLDEDSSQTQEELAETLGVTQQAISNRLKVMGMVQKQGNWVPYELKPGNIKRHICTCELLLKRQNRKGFLHRIVTGDEKWIHYDNPKRRKSWVKPGHASTSTAKPNIHGKKLMLCIWWDQLGVIYYELLQPNETITGERYQQQLMRLSRALKIKHPLYAKRHDKVIYQHDNARPHVAKVVKETLEALQWDVLPHPLYSPDIAPSDYHMFRSMTHGLAEQHFTSYEDAKNWVNVWIASKDEEFFQHGIRGWKNALEAAVKYHNRSYNSYLGCSPLFKFTGTSPVLPADKELDLQCDLHETEKTPTEQNQYRQRTKLYFNRRNKTTPPELKIGDFILVRHQRVGKEWHQTGPHRVTEGLKICTGIGGPMGVDSQLSEKGEGRIVACASRTLSDAERKYSIVEKEALACVWAGEKFRRWVWGLKFTLRTDQSSLTTLPTTKGNDRAVLRIARWSARLMNFDYNIEYKKGRDNVLPDYLSRLSLSSHEDYDGEVELIASINQDILRKDLSVQEDLILNEKGKILVPVSLRNKLLSFVHKAHQGMVRTKQRLRESYWWPEMDKDMEDLVTNCWVCKNHDKRLKSIRVSITPVERPANPWTKLGLDIVGPFIDTKIGFRFAITLIDYTSKWPEVFCTNKTTSKVIINFLEDVFSREGFPREIVTDNGTPFISEEFEDFLGSNGIKHIRTATHHPACNGEVENFNKTLKSTILTAHLQHTEVKRTIQLSLREYRSTPHTVTKQTPSAVLHGRTLRTLVHVFDKEVKTKPPEEACRQEDKSDSETSTYSPTSGSRAWLIRDTTCKMTLTLINTPLEKLNDQNYRSWKYNTKMMLIERELWKYVTEPAPDEEASRTIFNMKQEKALAMIALTISPSQQIHIMDCTTAQEAWDTLEQVYEPKSRSRILQLNKQFISIRFEEQETMTNYLGSLKICSDHLREAGAKMQDQNLAYSMLAGLPESYDGIIMTFSNVEDKEFTSSKVKHVLLAEYERRMARRVNNTNEALQFGTMTRKEDKKKKNFTCYKCGKEGHIARSCRGKAKTPAPNLQPPRCSTHEIAGSEMLTALSCAIPENSWVIDSSAIHHVCNKREWFTNFQGITSDPILRASGTTRAEGCGDIKFKAYVGKHHVDLKLCNVLYVPNVRRNLLSVSRIENKGKIVNFANRSAQVFDSENQIVVIAHDENGLYVMKGRVILPNSELFNSQKSSQKQTLELWHQRFCHVNNDPIERMAMGELVKGSRDSRMSSIDPRTWIRVYDNLCMNNGWESFRAKINGIRAYLEGTARMWYDRQSPESQEANWEDWCEEFIGAFNEDPISKYQVAIPRHKEHACFRIKTIIKLHTHTLERAATLSRAPPFSPLACVQMSVDRLSLAPKGSPGSAEQVPERPSILSQPGEELSPKNGNLKNFKENSSESENYANSPAGDMHANLAAERGDVTAPKTAATTSATPASPASLNWADSEMAEVDSNDGYTVVKSKKRRLTSTPEHAARQPGRPAEKPSPQQRKRPTGPRAVLPQEIKATRANIADARARQATTNHENYVFVELCPEIPGTGRRPQRAGQHHHSLGSRLQPHHPQDPPEDLEEDAYRRATMSFRIASINAQGLATRGRSLALCHLLRQHRVDIAFVQETNAFHLGSDQDLCLGYSAVVLAHPVAISGSGLACVFGPGVAVLQQRILWPGHIALATIDVRGEEMTAIAVHLAHEPRERNRQLELLAATAAQEEEGACWIIGDFNIRDRGPSSSSSSDALAALLDLATLVDMATQFDAAHLPTRVAMHGDQVESNRLDRILVPAGVLDRVSIYATSHYHLSDHRLVLLQAGLRSWREPPEERWPLVRRLAQPRRLPSRRLLVDHLHQDPRARHRPQEHRRPPGAASPGPPGDCVPQMDALHPRPLPRQTSKSGEHAGGVHDPAPPAWIPSITPDHRQAAGPTGEVRLGARPHGVASRQRYGEAGHHRRPRPPRPRDPAPARLPQGGAGRAPRRQKKKFGSPSQGRYRQQCPCVPSSVTQPDGMMHSPCIERPLVGPSRPPVWSGYNGVDHSPTGVSESSLARLLTEPSRSDLDRPVLRSNRTPPPLTSHPYPVLPESAVESRTSEGDRRGQDPQGLPPPLRGGRNAFSWLISGNSGKAWIHPPPDGTHLQPRRLRRLKLWEEASNILGLNHRAVPTAQLLDLPIIGGCRFLRPPDLLAPARWRGARVWDLTVEDHLTARPTRSALGAFCRRLTSENAVGFGAESTPSSSSLAAAVVLRGTATPFLNGLTTRSPDGPWIARASPPRPSQGSPRDGRPPSVHHHLGSTGPRCGAAPSRATRPTRPSMADIEDGPHNSLLGQITMEEYNHSTDIKAKEVKEKIDRLLNFLSEICDCEDVMLTYRNFNVFLNFLEAFGLHWFFGEWENLVIFIQLFIGEENRKIIGDIRNFFFHRLITMDSDIVDCKVLEDFFSDINFDKSIHGLLEFTRNAQTNLNDNIRGQYANIGIPSLLSGYKTQIINASADFQWPLIIANVKRGILGADFLFKYNHLVDINKRKLIDGLTNLEIICEAIRGESDPLYTISCIESALQNQSHTDKSRIRSFIANTLQPTPRKSSPNLRCNNQDITVLKSLKAQHDILITKSDKGSQNSTAVSTYRRGALQWGALYPQSQPRLLCPTWTAGFCPKTTWGSSCGHGCPPAWKSSPKETPCRPSSPLASSARNAGSRVTAEPTAQRLPGKGTAAPGKQRLPPMQDLPPPPPPQWPRKPAPAPATPPSSVQPAKTSAEAPAIPSAPHPAEPLDLAQPAPAAHPAPPGEMPIKAPAAPRSTAPQPAGPAPPTQPAIVASLPHLPAPRTLVSETAPTNIEMMDRENREEERTDSSSTSQGRNKIRATLDDLIKKAPSTVFDELEKLGLQKETETNSFHLDQGQDLCLGYSAIVTPPVAISGSGLACVFGPGVAVLRQHVLWPGHIALAAIDVHGEEMTIINAHLAHDPRERLEQLELLAATAIQERAWVLGDLNIREPSSSSANALAALLDLSALVDVATQFDAAHLPTRVASCGDQFESSRLDRILVPAGVLDRVTTYVTSHYHLSDHRLVLLQVGLPAVSPHQPRLAAMLRSGLALEHLAGYIRELEEDLAHDDDDGILLWDRWTTIKAGLLAEARSLHDPRHAASDGYVVRARGYIAAQLEASSIRADYPSLPDLVALRGGRNGFDWLVASSSEAWIRPPPDGMCLQPRRLRLLKLWEEASKILSLNHRAVPTSQLLDIPIIGGCRFLRPPDLLAPARWRGARDLLADDHLIARPTRSTLADAAALGAFCRRLTSGNAVGFGGESPSSSSSLAAAVVLRGTATPFLKGLTTRSARRALNRPRLAAKPISRFLARWEPTISPPSRIDWASLRRCAFSGHEPDAAFKLALHALPHPAHPASSGPSCPACKSVDRSLGHRYWSCSSIRSLIREAFNIIGRPPDLQAWIFGGSGLEDDALTILASAKLRVYRHFSRLESLHLELVALNEQCQGILLAQEAITDDEINKEFEDCERYIQERFDVKQRICIIRSQDKDEAVSTGSRKANSHVKLPELELRTYDGSLENWLPWWAQFAKVHDNEDLSSSDKFLYLRQAVLPKSEAYRVIASYPVTGDNYNLAVQALQERFGDPNILTELYVRQLLNLVITNVRRENKNLGNLYDDLSSHLRSLETLGIDPQLSGIFLYPLVESSLPTEILRIWQRHPSSGYGQERIKMEDPLDRNREIPERLKALMDFLKAEVKSAQRLKVIEKGFKLEEPQGKSHYIGKERKWNGPIPATVSGLFSSHRTVKCCFCERTNHDSWQCRNIDRLSPEDRDRRIRNARLCFRCLNNVLWLLMSTEEFTDIIISITNDIKLSEKILIDRQQTKISFWVKKYRFPESALFGDNTPTGILNLTSVYLTEQEERMLSMGLQYIPPAKPDIPRMIAGVESVMSALNHQESLKIRHSVAQVLHRPSHRLASAHIHRPIISKLQKSRFLVITKADKGNQTVLLNRSDYEEKMMNILTDSSTFTNISLQEKDDMIKSFKTSLRNMKKANLITNEQYAQFTSSLGHDAYMYGTPKIHKPGVPLRPIIAYHLSPAYLLAKFLSNILSPIMKNNPNNLYQIEKLNSENFETWKMQMKMILIHSDLWEYANSIRIKPETEVESNEWEKNDQKALATIVLSLSPPEIIHVKKCTTSAEAWKNLNKVHQPKGPATKVFLTKQLILLKMNPNERLQDYLNKFTSLADRLSEMDAQVPEDFLSILLLCSLPESYEGFRTAIETRDELPSFEALKVKMLEEEIRQTQLNGTTNAEQAFLGNPERKNLPSTSKPKPRGFPFSCHFCGKKGHKAADCRKRKSRNPKNEMVASFGTKYLSKLGANEWCLDSGATAHMCSSRDSFDHFEETAPVKITLANGGFIEALGKGKVKLECSGKNGPVTLSLEDVLFVPELNGNLFSISRCTGKYNIVNFKYRKAKIVNLHTKICIQAYERNGLYILSQINCPKALATREICIAGEKNYEKWHSRFGHLNLQDLKKLKMQNIVYGLPNFDVKNFTCEVCLKGKQTRLPFQKESFTRSREPLELVHTDICGPMRTKSLGGALYFSTFIDDFSGFIFTFIMKSRSEVFKGFRIFKNYAEKQTGKKLKCIRNDNAPEYLSREFKDYLEGEGIGRQLSVEYTPQQNGVAERANRTLVDMTRCFMIEGNLPETLWAELIHTATYIRNRCPRNNDCKTPHELFTKRKPVVSHLKIVGSKSFAMNNRPNRSKFAPRSEEYKLIGYFTESKAYRLWKPGTRTIIKSRDVRFIEPELSRIRNEVIEIDVSPQKDPFVKEIPLVEEKGSKSEVESRTEIESESDLEMSDLVDEPSESEVVISRRGRGRPRYIRTGKPGRPRKEYPTANLSTQELLEAKYLPDPKDAEEALSGRDSYFWKKAMEEEFDSLIENKTWELVDPPKNRNIIGTKWVFKTKCNSDGSVERHKARLVAKGYSQQYGIDYEETFAPVVRQSTIRMFLALAVEYNLILHQMDVQSAYLNGEIKEEIYMTQPENFVSRKYPERVCRLKKAIYGLKQAGIVWHERLDNELKNLGLKQLQSDNCVYIKHDEGILLVAIYVDDLIIAAEREDTLKSFKESMKRIFKIKDLGGINCCLGIRIQMKEDGSISIDQERYIEELLAKYRMKEAKPISTPMDSNSKLTKISSIEGENEPVKKVEYQSLIGSLIYLSVSTRPDIAYAVSALGQFSNDPRRQHWNAAKRVLRYLKGTSCLRITYRKSNEALHGYVDADWGGNLVDRKSHKGIVYFLARGPIAWESKKQQTVTLSSTESEYIALCEAGKEAVYLRALLDEMGFGELLNGPTVLKTDNQGAQQLARSLPFSLKKKVETEIDCMVNEGILQPIEYANWAAPIVPVLKKDGSLRICGDFRCTANKAIELDKYPLPSIDEIISKLSGNTVFSSLDLSRAYLQVRLSEEAKRVVNINTTKGLFAFKRLPYGVAVAPNKFQRVIDNLFADMSGVACYIDDILAAGKDHRDHEQKLELVFKRLQEKGLRLNKDKCKFAVNAVEYLGFKIDKKGLHPISSKIEAVVEAPEPTNVSQLRSFIGLLMYYSRFIRNIADILAPFYHLLKKNSKWNWTSEHRILFAKCKALLTNESVLAHYDATRELVLACDASSYGLGVVLSHRNDRKKETPVAFASRTLTEAERQYSQLEKEALRIIFGSGFDYVVSFKKGTENQIADCLSRAATAQGYVTTDMIINEENDKVVVPKSLQLEVLKDLHSTHLGIVKMKQLARRYYTWKNIDKDIENLVKSCKDCLSTQNNSPKAPVHHWDPPSTNWERIHLDYTGPFQGYYYLVLIDAKSRWAEIKAISEPPTSLNTIKLLNDIFSTHGYPFVMVSDNASIFTCDTFPNYCLENGIRQKFIAPGHPATNGFAERNVQTLKNKLKSMINENVPIHQKIQKILLRYRATPLASGRSPSEMYLNRQIHIKLDAMRPYQEERSQQQIQPRTRKERVQKRIKWRRRINVSMATTNLNYPRFREGEDLNCYLEQLEECFKLNKTLEADKVSVLLTSIDVNVYKTLRDLLVPRRPSDLKYKDLVEVLTSHLYPIKNKHYERYLFHKIVQKENEPVGKFVLRLKSQADKCKFTDINENLCDQFVSGCFDEATLKRLLSEPFLTFDSAINIANSVEAAKSQVNLMKNPGHDIDKLKARSKNFKFPCKYNNPCKICGKSNHDTKLCKFKNAQCYICNKKGHIAPVCWNKKSAQNSGMNKPNLNKLNTIQCNTLENAPKIMVNVKIEEADTIMEVDTGADVSVVSKKFFLTNLKNVTLEKYSGHLKSFSGNLIPVFGKCLVNVSYKNYQEKLPLIVTGQFNNQTPLLGRNWIRILKADWPNCVFDICNNINVISNLELFLEVYKRVFENKDLPIQGIKGSISLRPNAKPKFFKFRPVPFSIKEKIDKELDRLEKSQIIEKVNASDWSTPLVTVIKSNGELRLCGDFKNTLNNCIEDEKYPLPTIETMLGNLGGNKIFTKLDLSSAYHQIEMDEASKNLLVVSTHRGLYRYNRLPFGISPASAIFQRCMDSLFHDVPNTVIYLDDIFIGSKDEQEHYRILKMIFDKLKELNFTLNKEKCLFLKKDICFLGHIINEDGVRPDSKKLEALERCKKPFDKTSLKSFLGMLSFYSKYIPNMSTLAGPLYQLLKKDNRWKWSSQCEKAFLNLKLTLLNSQALIHYSMKLPLTLTCDASAYGISGVLCHIVEGEEKPITFVSRTLSSAEVKYSQTEKEALAIVFATSKLRQYLFGRKFVLKSDHKALTTVFGNKRLLPPLIANRLHRWALELSNFDFDIRYTNKDTMLCADAFSRLPLEELNSREDNIDLVTHDISFLNVTPLDHLIIEEETNKDPVLNKLKEYLLEDPQLAKKDETMKPFLSKLENFSVLQGCIFVDSRAVIPRTCQDQMLKLLHQSHIGINRMKSLARSSVWWPKMDSQIEEFVKECSPCMHHQTAPPAENTPWPRTNQPWQRVHVDHFYFRGDCYLLVVDANSNWIEVFPVRGTTSQENIKLLRECFARYGLPQCLVSDNGPPFNSIEFKEFLRKNNVYHLTSPAYNPSSNGIAEVSVRIIKKSLEKSLEESPNSNMDCILQNVLFNYRNTPTSLDKPPVERLLSYVPRTFVNCLNSEFIQKTFGRNECGRRHFQVGDKVLFTRGKMDCNFSPTTKIEPLTGTNYPIWALKVGALLRGKKLFKCVISDPEPDIKDEVAWQIWSEKNDEAFGIIVTTLSDEQAGMFLDETKAKKVWDELKKIYMGNLEDKIIDIGLELENIKMKDNESINEYMARAKNIASQSSSLGHQISQRELAFHIVRGIHPRLEKIAVVLRTRRELTLDEIRQSLREEENRMNSKMNGSHSDENDQAYRRCTTHLSPHLDWMENVMPYESEINLAEEGKVTHATAKGDIKVSTCTENRIENVQIKGVLHVPNLRSNLLSIYELTNKGNTLIFNRDGAKIYNEQDDLIAEAQIQDRMYVMETRSRDEYSEKTENVMTTKDDFSNDTYGIRIIYKNSSNLLTSLRHPYTKSYAPPDPLHSVGAVYSVSCEQCSATYVGET